MGFLLGNSRCSKELWQKTGQGLPFGPLDADRLCFICFSEKILWGTPEDFPRFCEETGQKIHFWKNRVNLCSSFEEPLRLEARTRAVQKKIAVEAA
jgi:hypothetical protein